MRTSAGTVALACLTAAAVVAVASQAPSAARPDPTSPVEAMQQPAGAVSRVYLIRVKPGMEAQWMEAARKHVAWHQQQKDPFAWTAFYVETGRNTGMYGWITQNHTWADFDKYDATIGKADGEHAMATMGPYEESYTSGFSVGLPDLSNPPPAGSKVSLVSVEHFTIHPTKRTQFTTAIGKVHAALQKGGFTPRYAWSFQVSGNDGMVFTLALPVNSWAEMAEDPAFMRIMNEQMGAAGVESVMQSFNEAVISSEAWVARIIPELSYTPGG